MSSFSLFTLLAFLQVFFGLVLASPIQARDNACTACRAILIQVNAVHPEALFSCSTTLAERRQVFQTQICDTFSATSPNGGGGAAAGFGAYVNLYCRTMIDQFGTEEGGLFTTIAAGGDPATLCHEKFQSC